MKDEKRNINLSKRDVMILQGLIEHALCSVSMYSFNNEAEYEEYREEIRNIWDSLQLFYS